MPRDGRRDPTKEKFWRRMVAGQGRSGLSIRAWCREHGVREATLHQWRHSTAG